MTSAAPVVASRIHRPTDVAYWLWSVSPDALPEMLRAGTLALAQQGRARLAEVRAGDQIFVYLSGRRVLAAQVEAVGEAFEDATALVSGRHLPRRLRVLPRIVLPDEARVPFDGFAPHLKVLDAYGHLPPERRFAAVAQRVVHRLPALDGKVLSFVLQAREGADPEALMAAVEEVRRVARAAPAATVADPEHGYDPRAPEKTDAPASRAPDRPFLLGEAVQRLADAIAAQGFVYEPWHVAAYTVALRTRPFVLLAGATGVGKSRLPVLVAEATGGVATVVPVRPDWTDPAEAIGYTDLAGRFRPGAVLRAARDAFEDAARFHTLVLDEATLGRPEHYLADVLSRLEQRAPDGRGGWATPPLLTERVDDAAWQSVAWPSALGLVGTLNVDESGHALARKVLDRAFVLELSAPALADWAPADASVPAPQPWPLAAWQPRALRLAGLTDLSPDERAAVGDAVDAVAAADAILAPAGLAVGYRTRDEIALFVLHARDAVCAFRRRDGTAVAPLDAALLTKLVPRLDSVRPASRDAVGALLAWAVGGSARADDGPRLVERWIGAGRPDTTDGARFPLTAARLARVAEGAQDDGVVSFWS